MLTLNAVAADGTNLPQRGFFRDATGQRWNYVLLNLRPANTLTAPGQLAQTWLLAQEQPQLGEVWSVLGSQLLLAGGLAMGIALILAYILARSVARPVDRLARAADEIARGNYDHQVPVAGTPELARLAERFNTMAAEVRQARQMQRDFLANVSHDLKTPLTTIQGWTQAILDGAVQGPDGAQSAARIINAEARRMSRMVADLLDLAKLESGQAPMECISVDPAGLLRQAAELDAIPGRRSPGGPARGDGRAALRAGRP